MPSRVVTLLLLIVVCFGIGLCESVYQINISSNQTCPNDYCFTLPQFVNDFTNLSYGEYNITLVFLPGNHTLPSQLLFQDFTMVSLFSQFDISSNSTESVIICDDSGRFEFLNVSTVQVSRLTFIGCTGNSVEDVNQFLLKDSNFIGRQGKNGTALKIYHTSAVIVKSSFSHYDGGTYGTYRCYRNILDEIRVTAGSAIFMRSSNATIELSRFEGNRAEIGGAIHTSDSDTLTIINSTFVDNNAVLPHTDYINFCSNAGGGALYARDTKNVTLIDSNFTENYSQFDGGAVRAFSESATTVTTTDSEFNRNSANYSGGAVEVYSKSSITVTITDSEFNGNRANSGGAVEAHSDSSITVTITDSEFNGNSANISGGGAVRVYPGSSLTVTITDSEFNGNTAYYRGGAVVVFSGSSLTVTITDSEFNGNSAKFYGGTFYIHQQTHNSFIFIMISQTNFSNNNANSGGVLYLLPEVSNSISSELTMSNSIFIKNRAKVTGGVLWTRYSTVTSHNVQLINNSASEGGGVIYSSENSNINISNCNITLNSVDRNGYGGVAYLQQDTNITVFNTSFSRNRAEHGGVMWAQRSIIETINVTFIDNSANSDGGVFYTDQSNAIISQSNISNNRADKSGGTVYTDGGSTQIINSAFSQNSAEHGGVVWAHASTIESINVTLNDNSADTDGGVFYTDQTMSAISQSFFSNNHADNNGGTLYAIGGSTRIVNSKFSHNSAGSDGAVMRAYLNELMLMECDFNNNSADYEGGVLWTDQCSLNIIETKFADNIADCGGAIHLEMGDTVLNITSFMNNTANAGGALWASKASITTFSTTITTNRAKLSVLYLLSSNTVWSSITMSDNIGSMLSQGSVVIIEGDSFFVNNIQPSHTTVNLLLKGGAITAVLQSNITLKGICQFQNNLAEKGGALSIIGSMVEVYGRVTIAMNKATLCGGGMYLYHSSLISREDSTLTLFQNEGTEKGGGVMAISSSITINFLNSLNAMNITHNKAKNGGGFYFKLNTVFKI